MVDITYNWPVIVRSRNVVTNKLLCVSISTDLGYAGDIELAPLPLFHCYNVQQWKYVLDDFFYRNKICLDNIDLARPFFNTVDGDNSVYTGELLFIIESVLFCILEKQTDAIKVKKQNIKINALYSPSVPLNESIGCLKIKIRPNEESLKETANAIKQMHLLNPGCKFRLDGNQTFLLAELCQFIEGLFKILPEDVQNDLEYLEEPLKNFYDFSSFSRLYPYPQAIDESLLSLNDFNKIQMNEGTYFIIKPSLFGISKSLQMIKFSLHNGFLPVISSSYETKNTIRSLLYLASMNAETFHGLDTLKFLPSPYGIEVINNTLTFY